MPWLVKHRLALRAGAALDKSPLRTWVLHLEREGPDNHISRDLPQIGQLPQVREVNFEYAFSFTTFVASLFRPLLTVPVTFFHLQSFRI